jgi:hypothetical protein
MGGRNARPLSDLELARDYRDALGRAANAARQAALLAQLMESRGVATLKGDEPAEVDTMLIDAGRRSLAALDGAVAVA